MWLRRSGVRDITDDQVLGCLARGTDDKAVQDALSDRHVKLLNLAFDCAERGAFAWAGHSYAVPVVEALDLQPEHLLRVGILHYHDETDVTRFLAALGEALGS